MMYVTKLTAVAVAAAVFAILARRSEAQSMSFGTMAGPQSLLVPFAHSVAPASLSPGPDNTCGQGAPCRPRKCKPIRNSGPVDLFVSDGVTGNLYEYCEDIPPNLNTPRLTRVGIAGWGLAVNPLAPQQLAVGKRNVAGQPGRIKIYNVLANGALAPPAGVSTLKLGKANANALGICFDSTGGLYATNYNTSEIDYFNAAAVAGPGVFNPTTSWQMVDKNGNPFFGYYLACDFEEPEMNNIVMVDGVDASNNVDVAVFMGPLVVPPVIAVSQTFGPFGVNGPNYPGGMTLNGHGPTGADDHLVVSDTSAGVLVDLGSVEPWNNPSNNILCHVPGFPANAYLPIVFDNRQDEIWAGNLMPSGTVFNSDAVTTEYPLPPSQSSCHPGQSGGPTAVILNETFVGAAIWPNTGV